MRILWAISGQIKLIVFKMSIFNIILCHSWHDPGGHAEGRVYLFLTIGDLGSGAKQLRESLQVGKTDPLPL